MLLRNDNEDNLPPDRHRFDAEELDRQGTQLNIYLQLLNREIDRLNRLWDEYTDDLDPRYWSFLDINDQHLNPSASKSSQDAFFVFQGIGNYIIDFVLFHNVIEFFIKFGMPGSPDWAITIMTCFFPIGYFCGELAVNRAICKAKDAMDEIAFDVGAKVWFAIVCGLGLLYALFPSSAFAYVMNVAQEDNQQSPIFIVIMAILGIVIHFMVVFGGHHVIDARVRLWAKYRAKTLRNGRRKKHRQLQVTTTRVKIAYLQHLHGVKRYSGKDLQELNGELMNISEGTRSIIEFVDQPWHPVHPLGRPLKFRFGVYGNRRHNHGDRGNPPVTAG